VSEFPDHGASSQSTRREFTRTLALVAATPFLARGGEARSADEPAPPDPIAATAAALTEAARARFGRNLDEEHIKKIRDSIQRGLSSAQILKRAKLTNGDEPAFVFRAELP
jgi:hypothetical protein